MLHKLRWNLVFVVILLVSLFPVFSNAPGPVLAAGEAVRGELNSWGTWGMSSSLGGTFLYETGQMSAADDASSEFKFFKDSNEWYGGGGTITFAQIFTGMNTNTSSSNMSFAHTQNKYYVFKWNGSDKGAVFQLTATPVNVSDVNRAPAVPNSTDTVVITATTSTAPPTEQAVWLRYTTDAWSSSTVSKLSGSGTTYSTTIPAQSGGTTVDYYIFTSSDGSSIAGSEADLMTITYDNNSGSNYSYTIADAQALWLDADTIAWNGTAGSSYKLLYDPDGGMDTAIAGATACTFPSPSAPCYVTLTSSGAVSGYPKNPNATDLPRLLTGRSDANAKHLLKGQVVVAAYNGGGALVDVTHVQPQSVLDDLYATAAVTATLGVTYTQGLTPTVYLWAPTAKSVTLRRYANSTTTLSTTHPLTADAASGVWSVTGAPAWDRDFYLFDVEVYVPSEDAVLHNLVTDPYAVSLSTNSERSQLVDLDDADLKPAGWDTLTKPALANFEDITIYEMHLRDFSINDSTVVTTSDRGTYLAFTYDGDGPDANTTLSDGMEHLLALQAAGLTHVHLLPSFDIASVPEASVVRTPSPNPTGYDRDGEEPQATIALSRTIDGFNWGYDPYHYGAPEGSYSTDPDGVTRILEFRRMISALNQNGLRVVMDMVYNHTSASGQADKSVLDKIVPGYYYRYDTNGVLQQTSCCPDTACEYEMMEKLMVDTLVRFAEDYRVDGFRFDLMNLHTQRNMLNVQSAINAIDPDIYLYGEGWDFGSAKDKGLTDCTAGWCYAQKYNMTGKGIGLFNDIIRDATHGGYSQDTTGIRKQGFSNGLSYDWNGYAYSNRSQSDLHTVMDTLRSGLRASGTDWNGQGAPFTDDPQESVAYVEKHDNETLFDQNAFKLPHGDGSGNPGWIGSSSIPTTTLTDRVRAQNMGQSLMALSQGVPFFQMGTDILRSKSLDRNSYDSGDWFNKIYWDYSENNFGKGLPPAWDNDSRWDIMRPLLMDTTTLDPATANIEFAAAHFRELLRLRYSSPLFRLTTEADVNARASYYNDDNLLDGFLALRLSDEVAPDLDSSYENILVFFNANKVQQSLTISGAAGFTLHPLHTNGVDDDPVVQSAVFDDTTDSFTIPARTTVVFVSDQALTSPPAPSTLDWVGLLWPRGGAATRLDEGNASSDFNVYVQVYEESVTEAAEQGAGIDCYLHWGAYGESWATEPMTYNVDQGQGNNDEYMITFTPGTLNALPPGTYGFTAYCQKTAETGKQWKEDSYDIGGDSSDDDQGDGLLTVIPTGDTSPAPDGGVFVHLFEWPWADVEKECTFLAEKGYAAVQVSPPNEHLVPTADMSGVTTNDYPWWVRYQPVTHLTTTLTSRSGTWAEFTSMVDACNSLGVGIYVDAVINHTADIEVGTPPTGTHGTEYHSTPAASRAYGAQYQADDFHTECTISSYEDRQQVQLCELSGLPDLDTGKVEVQTEISNYLQALLDAGVQGFRIDGAKHIRAQDIAAILNGLTLPGGGTPFIFQEVIDQSSDEPVRDWEYAPHGDVTEFAYAFALGDKFDDACGGALSQLESRFDDADMLPSRFAVVFTDNHDNQRGHGVGSGCVVDHRDGQEHLLANIFALAYPYGYPKVMSSYYWQSSATDNNGDSLGPPSSADGGATWGVGRGAATRSVYGASQVAGDDPANCAASYEDGKWVCEHRQTAIANLVQFRQVTDGAAVSDWQNIAADHIAFGRGAKGFVALNRTGSNATTTYTTGMPEGDYCDSVSGQRTVDGSACTGPVISVNASHQIVNYTLASMSALAIHAEARLGAPQLDASQDFDLARAANGPVTATLQTHDGFDAPNQTITFTLESGAGSLGAPVVTATTDISGVASVTYTAPNTLTVAMVSAAYRDAEGTPHESLSAVYVDYRAAVAELLARRLATGEVSLSLGHTLTVTKQGSGAPLITLARFTGNPQSNRAGDSVKSAFVDLYLPDAAAVTTLTVEIACTATCASGDTIWWGNPVTGDWTAVTDAAAAFSGAQATFTLTVSSTPSLTQLSGTPFVVSLNEPLAISLHAFQATSGVPGRLLLVLLILAILGICASAFSRQRRAAR